MSSQPFEPVGAGPFPTTTAAHDHASVACQCCGGRTDISWPVDGGSDETTIHQGHKCSECGAGGALVVRDGVVIRRVGPACDPAFGGTNR